MGASTKLHLGCGDKIIEGFINIDVYPYEGVTVCRAEELPFEDNSIDLIYASHILEHYKKTDIIPTLREWNRVLKAGGILRIAVPDFSKLVKVYQEEGIIMGMLHGGQRNDNDIHYNSFDEASLVRALDEVGFRNFTKYDWRTTEHARIDDYSQAYHPHMDKNNGTLMSLNMEAIK